MSNAERKNEKKPTNSQNTREKRSKRQAARADNSREKRQSSGVIFKRIYIRDQREAYDLEAVWKDIETSFPTEPGTKWTQKFDYFPVDTDEALAMCDAETLEIAEHIYSHEDQSTDLGPIVIFRFEGDDKRVVLGAENLLRAKQRDNSKISAIIYPADVVATFRISIAPKMTEAQKAEGDAQFGMFVTRELDLEGQKPAESKKNAGGPKQHDEPFMKLKYAYATMMYQLEQIFYLDGCTTFEQARDKISAVPVPLNLGSGRLVPIPFFHGWGYVDELIYRSHAIQHWTAFAGPVEYRAFLHAQLTAMKANDEGEFDRYRQHIVHIVCALQLALSKADVVKRGTARIAHAIRNARKITKTFIEENIFGVSDRQALYNVDPLQLVYIAYYARIDPSLLWPDYAFMRGLFDAAIFIAEAEQSNRVELTPEIADAIEEIERYDTNLHDRLPENPAPRDMSIIFLCRQFQGLRHYAAIRRAVFETQADGETRAIEPRPRAT